jgi:hypothetical protein
VPPGSVQESDVRWFNLSHGYATPQRRLALSPLAPWVMLFTALTSLSTFSTAEAQPGLVAAYAFSESSGSTVADVSGNNNTGTLSSGVTRTTSGKNGSALVFNGGSFVTIPHSASLNLTTGMTLEAWLFPTVAATAWSTAIMKEQPGEFVYALYAGSPANRPSVHYNVSTTSSGERMVSGTAAVPANTWTHLAGTYDGATLRFYLNGAQVASQAMAGPIVSSTGALRIGGNGVWGEYFTGRIDDVRVYNRALSAAEIVTDMNTAVGGTPAPDTTPPTIAITAPTSGASYTTNASPLTLSGTANDNVGVSSVAWTSDRGVSGSATGTTSWAASGIALSPGANVITVTARDAANNPGSATLTVNYDPTPPTASISTPTTGPTFVTTTSPVGLTGTAGDNVAVTQVSWSNNRGGSGTASGTTNWSVPSVTLQPGVNVLTITARDAASNTGTATLTITYDVPDTTAPSVTITAPTSSASYTTNASPITLSGSATDNVGVTSVAWTSDQGASGSATGTTSWSASGIALSPGSNVITITARDAANNPGIATLTVNYDATPPTVGVTGPTSDTTFATTTSPVGLSGTAADNVAVTQVTWSNSRGGSGTATGTTNWSVASVTLQPGDNIITVIARDAAANIATATLTITYNVPDTTAPVIAITTPTSGATYATNVTPLTLSGTASDNVGVSSVAWSSDRGVNGSATGTTNWSTGGIALSPGLNVITITARDAANNPGTATLTVTYDTTVPTVSMTAPAAGSVLGSVTVSASAADNIGVAGVQFLLDGAALGSEVTASPYTTSWNTTTATNGSHTLSARARDAAGNTALTADLVVNVANPTGLVAAYSFNETSGATVTDISGNNNTGTLGSGVTRTTAGKTGGALVFNGSSFVTIPHSASLNLTTGMTVEAWVYPTVAATAWTTAVMKEQSKEFVYALYGGSPGNRPSVQFNVNTSPSGNGERVLTSPSAIPINTWTHVAGTYDGTTLRLYVNGTQIASQAFAGSIITSTSPLRIGGNSVWGEYFTGRIDDVRIYNRALTAAQIQSDMNTPVGGTPPPDTTPPTVAVTAPTSGATYTTNATPLTLSGTASDNVGVTAVAWSSDRGGSGSASGTTTWSASGIALSPGTNVITVTARDAANNPGTATLTVNYDATSPTVTISAPTSELTFVTTTSPLSLSGTAADNTAVTQVSWSNNRGGSGTASGTAAWSIASVALQPGDNVVTVTARDAAANTGAATLTVTYNAPDTTAPVVAITAPTSGAAYSTNASLLSLSGTASDNVGVTSVAWVNDRGGSGSATGTTSWSAAGIPLSPGANVITVTARDAAGNPATASLTVTYDSSAPTVSLTAPATGTVSGTIAVSASAGDNIGVAGVQFLLDGANLGAEVTTSPYTLAWNTGTAANGSHTLSARARDAAGNTTLAASVAVTVANTQPAGLVAAYNFNEGGGSAVTDTSGNNNTGTLGSGVTWTTQGKNGNALVFNGGAFVTIPHSASLNLTTGMTLEAWLYPTVSAAAWSSAIMKEQTGEFVYVLYAGSPANRPSVQFNVNNSTTGTGERAVTGSAALPVNTWTHLAGTFDGATLRLYVNGSLVASQPFAGPIFTSTGALRLGGNGVWGEYFTGRIDDVRVYSRALSQTEIQTDLATPVGGAPGPDNTPPSVTVTSPTEGSTVAGMVSLTASASDNVSVTSVQFFVDGTALGSPVTSSPYTVVWDTSGLPLGPHTLYATARDVSGNVGTSQVVHLTLGAAPNGGQWSAPFSWPIVSVHTVLMRTGDVLTWDQQFAGGAYRWNPSTNVFTPAPINTNIFCGGQCALPDGRVLVAGGHVDSHIGLRDTNIFDPGSRAWSAAPQMATPRWYPTVTALPDGRALITAGEVNCNTCNALIPEIYNPTNNTMTQLSGASLDLPYYPHMYVLPDGRVLAAATSEAPIISQVLDLGSHKWTVIDNNLYDAGSSVMYLPGKVMKTGTSREPDMPVFPSSAVTHVLDMTQSNPAWRETAAMAFPRSYLNLTVLPDGTVLATGGGTTSDPIGLSTAVYAAELWSPVTETWTTLSSGQIPRLYHSIALLLPDGRVLVSGGGRFYGQPDPTTDQLTGEIFSPPYLFKGPRPVIGSAPSTINYAGNIAIQTTDAPRIGSVSLIRLGSVTHAFNQDQRFVPLTFSATSATVTAQAPANANLAPPGYYMLFILDTNGVPSVASIVKLQ